MNSLKSCTYIKTEPIRWKQETQAEAACHELPQRLFAHGYHPVVWLRRSHPASLADLITLGYHGDLICHVWSPCGLGCTKPTSARFQSVAAGYVTALVMVGSQHKWSKCSLLRFSLSLLQLSLLMFSLLQLSHVPHLQQRHSFKCPLNCPVFPTLTHEQKCGAPEKQRTEPCLLVLETKVWQMFLA